MAGEWIVACVKFLVRTMTKAISIGLNRPSQQGDYVQAQQLRAMTLTVIVTAPRQHFP